MTTPRISASWLNQILRVAATGLWFVVWAGQAHALAMTVPVGTQEIGQILKLKGTLLGIPEGAQSQLRSTCLKANLRSLDSPASEASPSRAGEMRVTFEATTKRGGQIEFASRAPVNSAVVELQIVSDCPLVTFSNSWTLIMDPALARPVIDANQGREISAFNEFSLGDSALLAASRKPPPRNSNSFTEPETPLALAVQPEPVVLEKKPETQQPLQNEESESQQQEPLKVASLGQNYLNNGLIESHKTGNDVHGGLGLGMGKGQHADSPFPTDQNMLFLIAVGFLFLLILVYLGTMKYKVFRSGGVVGKKNSNWQVPQVVTTSPILKEAREPELDSVGKLVGEPAGQMPGIGQDRFLESLISSDEKLFDESFEMPVSLTGLDRHDLSHRSALKVSLELINRADIRKWRLPDSYQNLVEERNRSLEQNKMTEALILRCQIGLVELTFQDAKQAMRTSPEIAHELLSEVLDEYIYDAQSYPALGVPDVVKSHVRAKMCEIAGAENRQLLRDNLVNLNTQITSPALCFHTDAWREFLSEEGLLD